MTSVKKNTTGIYFSILLIGIGYAAIWTLSFTATDPFFLAPFRESQTAISTDYLLREPTYNLLEYQLPVFGYPWRIPHEFPFFQGLTACVVKATGIPLEQAGRLVNLAGLLLCLPLIGLLWSELKLPEKWRWHAVVLVALSPIYMSYGTAHLMESWALLFALAHMVAAWVYARKGGGWWLAMTTACGVLAALIKITTWLPAGCLVGLLALAEFWRALRTKELAKTFGCWGGLLIAAVIAFGAGTAWSEWCATVRSANVMNEATQSTEFLRTWVFGTIADRFSVSNWLLVFGKHLMLIFGPFGVLVPSIIWMGWRRSGGAGEPEGRGILFGLGGYFGYILVFLRLNLRHDYYIFAAAFFLVIAVVCALAVLAKSNERLIIRFLMPAMAASMAAGGLTYTMIKRGYRDLATERAIEVLTSLKAPGTLVVLGFDWSPRIAFATGRKAIMVNDSPATLRVLPDAIKATSSKQPVVAVLSLGDNFLVQAKAAAKMARLDCVNPTQIWPSLTLFISSGTAIGTRASAEPLSILQELERLLPAPKNLKNGIVYEHFAWFGENSVTALVVKRGSDAFYFQPFQMRLYRLRGYFPNEPSGPDT